ncbi:porin [Eikenella sp. Marseille-P7795]|uniref:porin n=1 Tax=Eikenella sp. Marseille-P7795 TaxID=2866577 RepID=UPI001CE42DFC|nr:porin [Eikenella sp. Marseille-P7795]
MKKTLIALALVSLPVAASAEVILYGKIRGGVEFTRDGAQSKNQGPAGSAENYQKNSWSVVDYSSYIGFKGSEDLGGNLKVIWQVENRVNLADKGSGSDSSKRDTFIGLEGGFGTFKLGHVTSPLKETLDAQDNWEYNSNYLGLGRYGRFGKRRASLNYHSPDFGGFDFGFQLTPGKNAHGGDTTTNDGRPVFGLGLGYKNSGFFGRYAVEYARRAAGASGDQKDVHVHNLSVGYDANNLYVAGAFQYGKNVNPSFNDPAVNPDPYDIAISAGNEVDAKTKEAQISAAYTFGAVTPKITVAYGRADTNFRGTDGARYLQAIVGADYAFSRRTTGLVSVGWLRDKVNSDAEHLNSWGIGTGLVHKF